VLADGKWIDPEHLPPEVQRGAGDPAGEEATLDRGGLEAMLAATERRILERFLAECGTTHAMARRLGVNQSTIVRKLRKLGVKVPSRARG
jgi:TyrR family helix-turn-helix protein